MSLDMSFVVVPLKLRRDDDSSALFRKREANRHGKHIPLRGVTLLKPEGEHGETLLHFKSHWFSMWLTALTESGNEEIGIDFLTGGPLSWDSNGRYLMLHPRREMIERMRVLTLKGEDSLPRRRLLLLFDNCERLLHLHGEAAALVIN